MDNLVEIASRYALPAAAAAIVGAMYTNAKHHIVEDIDAWRANRRFRCVVAEASKLMGDYYTLYHAIGLNDPKAEAFWFEGRS